MDVITLHYNFIKRKITTVSVYDVDEDVKRRIVVSTFSKF